AVYEDMHSATGNNEFYVIPVFAGPERSGRLILRVHVPQQHSAKCWCILCAMDVPGAIGRRTNIELLEAIVPVPAETDAGTATGGYHVELDGTVGKDKILQE